jgi:putative ABC transport system permease protein
VSALQPLQRKLLRDVWHLRGPFLAVALVIACGTALFVGLRSMKGYLIAAQADYYRSHRFAEVFARAVRAPQAIDRELANVPGVAAVECRVVADVLLEVPGLVEPATGRVVSLREDHRPTLNDLYLRRGRLPRADEPAAVVVSEAFARANRLDLGDRVGAVLHGRWQRLRIVGTALSPEFVYEIRGAGDVFPDNRRFGALWMNRRPLATAFDLDGACNDVVATLAPGAIEPAVLAAFDRVLLPYGGRGAYGRDDHVSHRFLSDEIAETKVTSLLIPSIFLAVSAFLVHLVVGRLVGMQRDQIAVLKAFGYPRAVIARHYVGLAMLPAAGGGVLGAGVGGWLAHGIAAVYADFFQFPAANFHLDPGVVAVGVVIAVGAALAGSLQAASRALALPPAEAMRPEAPAVFRTSAFDARVLCRLPPAARVSGRHLLRQPLRAGLSVLGLGAAGAILIASRFIYDAVDWIALLQFDHVQREDVAVTFGEPRAAAALDELTHLPGVLRVEPFRAVDARLVGPRAGHRSERVALLGLAADGRLRRVVDETLTTRPLPVDGLLVSSLLAERLGAVPGDHVAVTVLEGRQPQLTLTVEATTDDLVGTAAYLEIDTLRRALGEGEVSSGAFLAVDPRHGAALYDRLRRLPGVGALSIRQAARDGFERTIAESFRISLGITVLFACVIAVGMVYNGARVALSERGRELASLRVLGFTRREVAAMLLGEQSVLTLASLPVAFALGYGLCWLMAVRFASELFRIPLVVSTTTLAFALLTMLAAAAASALLVRRRIDRLDLVAVLKTRE